MECGSPRYLPGSDVGDDELPFQNSLVTLVKKEARDEVAGKNQGFGQRHIISCSLFHNGVLVSLELRRILKIFIDLFIKGHKIHKMAAKMG